MRQFLVLDDDTEEDYQDDEVETVFETRDDSSSSSQSSSPSAKKSKKDKSKKKKPDPKKKKKKSNKTTKKTTAKEETKQPKVGVPYTILHISNFRTRPVPNFGAQGEEELRQKQQKEAAAKAKRVRVLIRSCTVLYIAIPPRANLDPRPLRRRTPRSRLPRRSLRSLARVRLELSPDPDRYSRRS